MADKKCEDKKNTRVIKIIHTPRAEASTSGGSSGSGATPSSEAATSDTPSDGAISGDGKESNTLPWSDYKDIPVVTTFKRIYDPLLPESHYKRLETKLNEVAGTIIVTLKAITDHKTDFVRQQDFLVCGEIKEFISRYWKTTFDLRFRGQSYHTDDPAFNDCTYNKDTSEFSPWFSTEKFKYDEMVARFHGNILYLSEIFVTLASISLGNYRISTCLAYCRLAIGFSLKLQAIKDFHFPQDVIQYQAVEKAVSALYFNSVYRFGNYLDLSTERERAISSRYSCSLFKIIDYQPPDENVGICQLFFKPVMPDPNINNFARSISVYQPKTVRERTLLWQFQYLQLFTWQHRVQETYEDFGHFVSFIGYENELIKEIVVSRLEEAGRKSTELVEEHTFSIILGYSGIMLALHTLQVEEDWEIKLNESVSLLDKALRFERLLRPRIDLLNYLKTKHDKEVIRIYKWMDEYFSLKMIKFKADALETFVDQIDDALSMPEWTEELGDEGELHDATLLAVVVLMLNATQYIIKNTRGCGPNLITIERKQKRTHLGEKLFFRFQPKTSAAQKLASLRAAAIFQRYSEYMTIRLGSQPATRSWFMRCKLFLSIVESLSFATGSLFILRNYPDLKHTSKEILLKIMGELKPCDTPIKLNEIPPIVKKPVVEDDIEHDWIYNSPVDASQCRSATKNISVRDKVFASLKKIPLSHIVLPFPHTTVHEKAEAVDTDKKDKSKGFLFNLVDTAKSFTIDYAKMVRTAASPACPDTNVSYRKSGRVIDRDFGYANSHEAADAPLEASIVDDELIMSNILEEIIDPHPRFNCIQHEHDALFFGFYVKLVPDFHTTEHAVNSIQSALGNILQPSTNFRRYLKNEDKYFTTLKILKTEYEKFFKEEAKDPLKNLLKFFHYNVCTETRIYDRTENAHTFTAPPRGKI